MMLKGDCKAPERHTPFQLISEWDMRFKHAALAAALLIGGSAVALAQNTSPNPTNTDNPRPTYTPSPSNPAGSGSYGTSRDTNVPSRDAGDGMLKPGANSFTEDQARRRIEDRGYTGVGQLHKDQNSIWQAEATKEGRRVRVGLDYRGNVVEEK